MATESTITVFRGERATLNFTMSPVVNITGWTLAFTVAARANSSTKLIAATPSIVSGTDGTFRVSLTTTNLNIAPGHYYFDVWRTDSGYEEVLAYGPFVIAADAKMPA